MVSKRTLQRLGLLTLVAFLVAACSGTRSSGFTTCKIAFLLPEKKTARYETQDLPNFKNRLKELGLTEESLIYNNANQDATAQQQQAEAALTNGAKVLVIDPVDSDAAGKIAELAQSLGVPVIAYDRMVKGSSGVSYYISFENEEVGKLQGTALLAALGGRTFPTVVMLHGSLTDNNSQLYKQGALSILKDKVNIVREYDTPEWSADNAQKEMEQSLTALNGQVDGVYAANDGLASGAIAAMKAAGITPLPPVTGQDAELAAIQRILLGEQYMTIYKAIRPEAEAAAELAYALCVGDKPDESKVNYLVNNGQRDIPAILLKPVSVNKDNIKDTVIADRFWSADQICTAEIRPYCDAAGIR
jgi:D-xylose transport system substrate-binding protein